MRPRQPAECGGARGESRLFGIGDVLTAWKIDPAPLLGVAVAGLAYAAVLLRLRRTRPRAGWPPSRVAAFATGLLVLLVALSGPPDPLSNNSLTAHMVQHLLIQLVAAPLLLLGGPVSLLLRASPRWLPRRTLARVLHSRPVRLISYPPVTFMLFAAVLVGSHLPPVYNAALEREWVHYLEHGAYLVTALLFWWPAIGADPAPRRLTHPVRMLYLLLAMPVMAFLGMAIATADRVLYPYYATHPPPWGMSPLADQHMAGTLMWVAGMLTIVPALGITLLRWLDLDEREQARREAVHDRLASGTMKQVPAGVAPAREQRP